MPPEDRLVYQEAVQRGIEVTIIPGGKFRLQKGENVFVFGRCATNLNTRAAIALARDKFATSRILRMRGFRSPASACFQEGEEARGWDWAQSNLPVVVKPNAGRRGELIHLDISERSHFLEAFASVAKKFGTILVEKYLPGETIRFTVVNNQVVAAFTLALPTITGDGSNSVRTLIRQLNLRRSKAAVKKYKRPLKADDLETIWTLKKQGLDLDAIPAEGRSVVLNKIGNRSTGAYAIDVTDSVSERYKEVVERASRCFPGLVLSGWDIIVSNMDSEPAIVDVNGRPQFAGHYFPWEGLPRNPAPNILDAMFPNEPPEGTKAKRVIRMRRTPLRRKDQSGKQTALSKLNEIFHSVALFITRLQR
jgi:cyanophycin synthetase